MSTLLQEQKMLFDDFKQRVTVILHYEGSMQPKIEYPPPNQCSTVIAALLFSGPYHLSIWDFHFVRGEDVFEDMSHEKTSKF